MVVLMKCNLFQGEKVENSIGKARLAQPPQRSEERARKRNTSQEQNFQLF